MRGHRQRRRESDRRSAAQEHRVAGGSLAVDGHERMGDMHKALACSVPYLKLWGVVAGGWQMARAAQIAAAEDRRRRRRKSSSTRPSSRRRSSTRSHVLTQGAWYKRQIIDGSADVMTLTEEQFELDRKIGGDRITWLPGFTLADRDGVRILTLDNPPINALGFAFSEILALGRRSGRERRRGESGRLHRRQQHLLAAVPTSTTSRPSRRPKPRRSAT